ncbi:MAG: M2 family metallopeptidase, partial [Bryobacteraceae bacterium]
VSLFKEGRRYERLKLPSGLASKFKLLRLSLTLAAPSDPIEAAELTGIVSRMKGTYRKGKYCPSRMGKRVQIDAHQLPSLAIPFTLLMARAAIRTRWHRVPKF